MGAQWPLVGRGHELADVAGLILGRREPGVLIAGSPGAGRTRFGLQCLLVAEQHGLSPRRATATRSASGLPFGALAHLLPPASATTSDEDTSLIRHLTECLTTPGDGRVALLVDDAHLLDDASAAMLLELALSGAAFVLVTVRTGVPAPDAVQALWRDGVVPRLDLDPLSPVHIGELLAAALGGRVDQATTDTFVATSAGNLQYLRELVVGAQQSGSLSQAGEQWRLVGQLTPSARLIELVEARLAGLDPAERELLEHIACGEPLDSAVVAHLGDASVVERMDGHPLLRGVRDGQRLAISIAHPAYAEVLRAGVAEHRRTKVLRRLVTAVEAAGAGGAEDALRIATWRLDSGAAGPDLLARAADIAHARGDLALTERLARAAVEAGAGFAYALLSAQMASLQGRGAEAELELAGLAELAENDDQRGTIAITRLDNFAFLQGRSESGLEVADQAESIIVDDAWRHELAGRRSSLLLGVRGPRAAAEVAEPLLDRATGRGLAWAGQVACFSFGRLGRFDAALDAAERGRGVHMALEQPMEWYLHLHANFRCDALAHSGRLDEAENLAGTHFEQGVAEGSREAQAFFGWQLCKMVGDRGDVNAAIRNGRTAVTLFRELGRPLFAREAMVALTLALALAKRTQDAIDVLNSVDSLLPTAARFYMGVDLLCARAWAAASDGDRRNALRHLVEAARLGEEIGDLVGEANALHTIARLGLTDDVTERLATLAGRVEGTLIPARAEHAAALHAADEDRLATVATTFEDMGAHLLAAEASAAVVAISKAKGASRRAATAARVAAAHAARCRGARTPGLHIPDPQTTITPAEQRTARLAAAGDSNRDIADQLSLSVRTVENHLQRVYVKLGITGREQLVDALASSS